MLSSKDALKAADRAASGAWSGWPNKGGTWLSSLPRVKNIRQLADFIDGDGGNSEAVYRFAVGAYYPDRPWENLEPQLRVAIEVFRATYVVLMTLVVREPEPARTERRDMPSMPRTTFDRTPSPFEKRGFEKG